MPVENEVIEGLMRMGLTGAESQTYLALLKASPATGYEIATRSKVPRSAIYNVLKRLEALGLVNAIQQKPAKFVPLPAAKMLELFSSRFTRNLGQLERSVENLVDEDHEALTWTVRGYEPMLERAERLISEAERTLHASLWRREADALLPALEAAVARDVALTLFSFNRLPDVGRRFTYGIEEAALEAYWPHRIIVIADGKHLLAGGAERTEDNRAVVTDERALVEMGVSNLVLDLTLYGQRKAVDVGDVIFGITQPLAPIEALMPADDLP